MAYAWTRKGETPRKVAYHFTRDLDAIDLRVATETDPEDRVFTVEEMGDLWLTLVNSGFNVRNSHVVLYLKEKDENGDHIRLEPEITTAGQGGKEYGYAYTPEQLKGFGVPKNLHLMSGNYGGPLLIVGQAPYEKRVRGRQRRETPTIQRMTATPTTPQIKRQKAR